MNENFEPNERQEKVLDVFKAETRVNPLRLREATGLNKQRVNDILRDLQAAGWVHKVNRGLYEFVGDPREADTNDTEQNAD